MVKMEDKYFVDEGLFAASSWTHNDTTDGLVTNDPKLPEIEDFSWGLISFEEKDFPTQVNKKCRVQEWL